MGGSMIETTFQGAAASAPDAGDSPMSVRSVEAGGFVRADEAFREAVGFSEAELAGKPFVDWILPEDRETCEAALAGDRECCQVGHRTAAGDSTLLNIHVANQQEGAMVLARGATDDELGEPQEEDEEDEATVRGTLHTIARIIEDQNPGYKCSILLVADGRFVRGAGPSLPEDYNAAIDGYAVGPAVGSCGTAIYWNVPVVVDDIQADPLWAPFAELAKKAGVAACWSHPFTSRSGNVLGALALNSPEPRKPTAGQLKLLKAAARMTGLAVERGRAEEALRTKRKRELELEEQLRQAAKMEALGVLAGGVAHDFNNVLGTILGNAQLAQDIAPSDSELEEFLQAIVDASRRAGKFCQQMLAYAGRGSLKKSLIELGSLPPQLDSLVKASLSKKARLEYSLHTKPIFVEADENQILQVIMNLITNAAEALGENEGRIVLATDVADYAADDLLRLDPQAGLPAGEYARLTVTDNGSGMDPETASRIFDPFFTTKFTGRGLGLSAVQGIVAKHSGVIHCQTAPGEGTTFTILLPTAKTSAPDDHRSEPDVPVKPSDKRVLVVDDDDALRKALVKRLERSGFAVAQAVDGREALDVFSKDPQAVDCVLLDVSMPRLNGDEVHREMIALRADVPVIVMSGFNDVEVLERFDGASLAGVLQKPVAAKDLLAAINQALAK